jgi:hypothetical protein
MRCDLDTIRRALRTTKICNLQAIDRKRAASKKFSVWCKWLSEFSARIVIKNAKVRP